MSRAETATLNARQLWGELKRSESWSLGSSRLWTSTNRKAYTLKKSREVGMSKSREELLKVLAARDSDSIYRYAMERSSQIKAGAAETATLNARQLCCAGQCDADGLVDMVYAGRFSIDVTRACLCPEHARAAWSRGRCTVAVVDVALTLLHDK